jgi:hypothetical protein
MLSKLEALGLPELNDQVCLTCAVKTNSSHTRSIAQLQLASTAVVLLHVALINAT